MPFASDASLKVVEVASKSPIQALPLQVVSSSYKLYNPDTGQIQYDVLFEVPDGWSVISGDGLVDIPAKGSTMRIASFKIPLDAVSGNFKMRIVVRSSDMRTAIDASEVEITVLPYPKIELYPVGTVKAQLIAGDKFSLEFNVQNSGNIPLLVDFQSKTTDPAWAKINSPALLLGVGQNEIVPVNVEISEDLSRIEDAVLIISARATKVFDEETVVEKSYTHRFTVYPKSTGKVDEYHRLPGEIIFRGVAEDRDKKRSSGQVEVSLKGPLSDDKSDEIDLLYKGPNPSRNMIFFSKEESAHLAYKTKDFGLFLGDNHFDLSPLIDMSRSGRGIEIEAGFNDLKIDSFFARSQKGFSNEDAIGVDLLYSPSDETKLSFNFLDAAVGAERLPFLDDRRIWGVRGQFGDSNGSNMDIEYARGGFASRDNISDAFKFEGRLHKENLDVRFKHIDAGKDYPGYYRGQTMNEISGSIPVGDNFDITGNWRQQRRSFGDEGYDGSIIDDRFFRIGVDYNVPSMGAITFDYIDETRRDIFDIPRFDNTERYWRLGASVIVGGLTLGGRFELGNNEDRLRQETVLHISQLGMFSWRVNEELFISGFADYRRGDFFNIDRQNSIRTGLTFRYNPARNTFISSGLNCEVERHTLRRWNIPITFRHTFKDGEEIEVRARHSIRSRGAYKNSDTAVMVEYSIPLSIPIDRRKDIGTLTGFVRDIEKGGVGIPDVLVRAENKASMTDKDGHYVIKGLPIGSHTIIVESESFSSKMITIPRTPVHVDISSGKLEIDFDVVTSSDIEGSVFIPSNKDDVPVKMIADVMIELTGQDGIERILSDESGRFNFENLSPGLYKLTVDKARIPSHYHLETEQFGLELKPGETCKVDVRVVEDLVKVQIIKSGELSVE